jgi:hypothetical protein
MKLAANVPETCCRFEFWAITESIDNNETKVRENGGTKNKQTIETERQHLPVAFVSLHISSEIARTKFQHRAAE